MNRHYFLTGLCCLSSLLKNYVAQYQLTKNVKKARVEVIVLEDDHISGNVILGQVDFGTALLHSENWALI